MKWQGMAGVALALMLGLCANSKVAAKPADLPLQDGVECPDGSDGPQRGKLSLELGFSPKGIIFKFSLSRPQEESAPALDAVCPAIASVVIDYVVKHAGSVLASLADRHAEARAAKHAKAQQALEVRIFEPVSVRIKDVPLEQAFRNLAHASGVNIVIDGAEMRESRIDTIAPVTLAVEDVSLHTALQQLLHPLRLTFEVRDNMIVVTSCDRIVTPAQRLAAQKNAEAQRLFELAERQRRSSDYDTARKLYQQVHLLTPTTLHGRVAIVRIIELEERVRDTSEEQGGPIPGRSDDNQEQVYRHMHNRSIPLGLIEVSY